MSPSAPHPAEADWAWVSRPMAVGLGGFWTFALNRTPAQVIESFGMDPAAARMMTLEEGMAAYDTRLDEGGRPIPWIRVGTHGKWAFAFEDMTAVGQHAAGRLSAGTRAAYISWTPNGDHEVALYEDGRCVVAFEPWMRWSLSGSDPARFEPQMQETGVMPCPEDAGRVHHPSRMVLMLGFLTRVAGLRIPERVARGPLLTCAATTP
ncbi:hypothetical protein FH608_027605 [Nonomuraea phyllanthi]|uniref:Uncharacterized protein n=1 Tax=Nonomuraea phyllanthi TaxID=2219224 RepID=A0A5C4W3W4_9ACTN|nr:DUF6461 domain-containing protein [Nonomuraea phyllanthi]KAB8191743.1 hypothetical protein FH608_027605 [Nonomuraea phyllanthi]